MSSSFAPECTEAKKEYDDCFNNWYTESKFWAITAPSWNGSNTDLLIRVLEREKSV
jgi:hypothetical protein